jgi:hypothetical protein
VKVLTRGASGVCVLALFALAMWFTNLKPHLDGKLQHPLIGHGRIGQVTGNRVFSVKVTRVDVASAVVKDQTPRDLRMYTPGIFVIVTLNARSNREPLQLGHIRLVTRGGVSYDETGRTRIPDLPGSLEPLLWRSQQYVFEIPKDRLAGARFVAGQDGILNNLSAETEIDLGLSHAEASRLLARPVTDFALKPSF